MSVPEHDYAKVCEENRNLLDKVSMLRADVQHLRKVLADTEDPMSFPEMGTPRGWLLLQRRAERAERQAEALAKALDRIEPFLSFASKDYEDGLTEESAHILWKEACAALAAYRDGKP